MTLVSLLIYGSLFVLLYLLEWLIPAWQGTLLQWHNPAWLVGIPASVLGSAYVLTVRNPDNYTGFYLGIAMSALLAVQCYLQHQYDLVFLYLAVFIPFLVKSILHWQQPTTDFLPSFLSVRYALSALGVAIAIVAVDYWLAGSVLSAIMIASSLLANFLMIYKKVDTWYYWLLYCASGLVLFVLVGNWFSVMLFAVMLLVNLSGLIAWLKIVRQSCDMN